MGYGEIDTIKPGVSYCVYATHQAQYTGGTLTEVSAYQTKLSQYCHQCRQYHKKPRSQRWHQCPCGFGPVQRDLYSAFLLAYLEPEQTIPSITQQAWEGAEPRLRAVMEGLQQRAKRRNHSPEAWA